MITLTLEKKILSLNKTVAYLIFSKPKWFNFKSWQFMILQKDWFKKPYSIASSPLDKNLCFYVKKVSENGMSNFLVNITEWETINTSWPFWHMVLDFSSHKDNYLLISTWSWFAPILSIYTYLIQTNNFNKIVNIFWEKNKDSIPHNVLEKILSFEKEKLNIKNFVCFSRQKVNWFLAWHVQDFFESALEFLPKNNLKIYICWKPQMVDDSITKLKSLWVDESNILYEKY